MVFVLDTFFYFVYTECIYIGGIVKIAKVFKSGNSQAVRIPKEFVFTSKEVEIFQRNDEIILREVSKNLGKAFELLTHFPNDCFSEKRKVYSDSDIGTFHHPLATNL